MVCRDSRLIFHNGCSYQQVHPDARPQGVQGCTIPASKQRLLGTKGSLTGASPVPPHRQMRQF